jgi:peptide/nickel transport system ATP-binding protein
VTVSERAGRVHGAELPEEAAAAQLLRVENLTVRTRMGRTLVRDVSLALAAGQTLGIVGESGSGKTMTARSLVRILPANVVSAGSIRFKGAELTGMSERALRRLRGTSISMVLQDPFTALNPLQTVREHLRESLRRSGRRDRKATTAEIGQRLREVGLDPDAVAGKFPFQLSGGMRQRVALAAALAADPDLLIADEPTTALDVTTQAEVLELLKQLQRDRGMAMIFITHDLRVAFSICDRVMVMYAGSIVEDAPAAELDARPQHPYSLGLLLAEPPVSHYVSQLSFIPGSVPAADSVAAQCSFAARCGWAAEVCHARRPELTAAGPGRESACVRLADIREELELAVDQQQPAAPARTRAVRGEGSLLVARGLTKTYRTSSLTGRARTTVALQDVSFEIGAGESVGLVGETGSGKTTVARCILGLASPDSGELSLAGIDISRYRNLSKPQLRQARRLVQVVFQDPYASLNPALTIGSSLSEALAAGPDDGTRPAVAELLEMVGLPASYAGRRPAALSGGERQRTAIARAIAVRPRLLICDEPVAALDVSVQAQVLELLRDVRARYGTSLLFITHDLSVVRQMTDRALVLRHGQIVESGSTAAMLDNPQHPYTIRLIESIPPDHRSGPVA